MKNRLNGTRRRIFTVALLSSTLASIAFSAGRQEARRGSAEGSGMWRGPGGDRDLGPGGPGMRPGGPPMPPGPPCPPGPPGGMGLGPRELDQLDLSNEQYDQIDELASSMRKEGRTSRRELRQLEDELQALWRTDQPVIATIEAKLDEVAVVHTRLAKREAAFRLAVIELLTADQRARLRELSDRPMGRENGPPPPPRVDRDEE